MSTAEDNSNIPSEESLRLEEMEETISEPAGPHGLIFVNYMDNVIQPSDGMKHTYYRDGVLDDTVIKLDVGEAADCVDGGGDFRGVGYAVYCIDSDTGAETEIATFYVPDSGYTQMHVKDRPDWWFSPPEPQRKYFSDDYSKMACKIFSRKGCEYNNGDAYGVMTDNHVGWIDTKSNFFDVTAALTLGDSSLHDLIRDQNGFSGEFFGCTERTDTVIVETKYYVPVNDVSSDNLQEGDVQKIGHPNGIRGEVTSWIDDTHAIVNSSKSVVINNMSYSYPCSKIADTETSSEYIPEGFGDTWNGVASPDGSQIAFMSTSGVYIIPTNGGEPIKVEIPHDLATGPFQTSLPKGEHHKREEWYLIGWQ